MHRFVITNNDLKEGEVNAPGFKNGTKIRISKVPGVGSIDYVDLVVNNKPDCVESCAVAVSPKLAKKCGYDFNYDIVTITQI